MSFSPALPWARDPFEQKRLKVIAIAAAALFLITSLLLSLIDPPPVDRAEAEKIPPRLARLVLERKENPPKPPEPVIIEEEEKPEEEIPPEQPKPEKKKVVVPEKKPEPTQEQVKKAREKASKSGLLAMRDQLAALRNLNADSLRSAQTQVGKAGTQRKTERDLIAKKAKAGSGGVATQAIDHSGGGSLSGRETTQVDGPEGVPSLAEAEAESRSNKRTHEEIKLAFDANSAAIDGIYRRALRKNPLLEGSVVLDLTIAPSGAVTRCTIKSSTLNDPTLESKLVARISLINFGARENVEPWSGNYQIDFVPGR